MVSRDTDLRTKVSDGLLPESRLAHDTRTPALAMLEPDRPHNFGAALRLTACLGASLHIIEPCSFPLRDRRIREAALDYAERADWHRHATLAEFDAWCRREGRRLVLLTTRASLPYHRATYRDHDVLLVGSESGGAPEWLHDRADLRVAIPLRPGLRSLNVTTAAAIVLAEAMRQTHAFDRMADRGNSGLQREEG